MTCVVTIDLSAKNSYPSCWHGSAGVHGLLGCLPLHPLKHREENCFKQCWTRPCSAGQEIHCFMVPDMHWSVHKGMPSDPILSQPSLFRIFSIHLCNVNLRIISSGGRDGLVGTATRYAGSFGILTPVGARDIRPALGPTQPLVPWEPGMFPRR